MKKTSTFLCGILLLLSLTACGNVKENNAGSSDNSSAVSESITQPENSTANPPVQSEKESSSHTESSTSSAASEQSSEVSESTETPSSEPIVQSESDPVQTQSTQTGVPSKPEEASQPNEEKEKSDYMMNIKIGENLLTATLERNSSAEALLKMLSDGPITVHMSDYARMEKVGTLPASLPRNDEHINTNACDLILYQGNQFVIYYDTNSWSLTRLGKINNITQSELKKILGTGDVTAVLSLP